jgi:hypothetical protein
LSTFKLTASRSPRGIQAVAAVPDAGLLTESQDDLDSSRELSYFHLNVNIDVNKVT